MDQSVLGEVTRLIRDKAEPFNILIVGHVGVGKSSLINSSNMAVAQTWNELAPFGGGTGLHSVKNNTTHLTPFTMFKPVFMAKPIDGYQKTIKMWDFAGIENLTEEAHIELLGLVLEGRVPENTDLVHLLNDTSLTREELDKKFPSIAEERRIHRVIMVCEANRDVPENLVQTVRRAAKTSDGRSIPIFLVFSKLDTVTDTPAYKERQDEASKAFQIEGNLERLLATGLYSDRNTNCSREQDMRFKKNDDIDNTLLIMWRVLLNPAYDESLRYENKEYVYAPPAAPKPDCNIL